MEPTLTPHEPDDDATETLLRAAPPRIADDGFTERVCAALPPREAAHISRTRTLVLASTALLGCGSASLVWHVDPALPSAVAETVATWHFETWHAALALTLVAVGMAWTLRGNDITDAGTLRA